MRFLADMRTPSIGVCPHTNLSRVAPTSPTDNNNEYAGKHWDNREGREDGGTRGIGPCESCPLHMPARGGMVEAPLCLECENNICKRRTMLKEKR